MVDIQKNGLIRVLPDHEVFNPPAMWHDRESCEMAIPIRVAIGFIAAGTKVRSK
jgi:hypothetical protein